MKNLLAENMLRFGVKNLNDKSKKRIELILEQSSLIPNYNASNPSPDMLPAPTIGKMAGKISRSMSKKAEEVNKNLQSQLQELTSHPAYTVLITALGNSVTATAQTWCWKLTHDVRLGFLNQTQEWLNTKEGRRALKKQNKLPIIADITRSGKGKKEIPAEPQPDIPGFEIPLDIAGKTVYKDNSIEIDSSLQQAIDQWVSNLQQQMESAKQANPNATITCVSAEIASSCSRLRNTKQAEGMTWNQLSKARAENVYKIITSRLQEIGVVISPQITKTLKGGYNGDGSSGPDPANKFTFDTGTKTTAMRYSKTGGELEGLSGPDANRYGADRYGKLLSTQAESHQYKFCTALIKFIVAAPGQEEPIKPEIIRLRGYELNLRSKFDTSGAGTRRFPVIKFKTPVNVVKNRLDACFVF